MDHPAPASSLWVRDGAPTYPALTTSTVADVVVVGGGIVGLTTATLLAEDGRDVVLLEARQLGTGTSGRTTAKVSALQGLRYRTIAADHGPDVAARYADAQLDGLSWMADRVATRAIDCAWDRRSAVTYATTASGARAVAEEAAAARAAGLDVTERADAGLPFGTTGAVVLEEQAQFDPGPYLSALGAAVDTARTGRVFEQTRVHAIRRSRGQVEVVATHAAGEVTVRAGLVVVATLLPITDRGMFFARAEPMSSYIVALHADGPLPRGMYLSADSPTRSVRTATVDDREVLLVGGEGHRTGKGAPTSARYRTLADWARQHFPVTDVVAQWSAHDYVTADHLPWVGPPSPLATNVLVATGFEKWGMTMGTAAALALRDHLMGDRHGASRLWADILSTTRLARPGIARAARMNAEVAVELARGWARPDHDAGADGRGARHRSGLLPVGEPSSPADRATAAAFDEDRRDGGDDEDFGGRGLARGTETTDDEVVVVCTHLGGVCAWNDAERTWDCPLHGSRFTADGRVLTGPAARPLALRHATRPRPAPEIAE